MGDDTILGVARSELVSTRAVPSLAIFEGVTMFKTHHQSILALILLLLAVSLLLVFYRIEWQGAYAACRKELPSSDGWEYRRIKFSYFPFPWFSMDFESDTAYVSCPAYWNGSEWTVPLISGSSKFPN